MGGTCGSTNRLVHERPAEVVDAGAEHHARTLGAELDPRHLNVLDERIEHQTRGRMQHDGLLEGRAEARATLQRDRCLLGDKRQRYELGEAAGFALEITDTVQMARHVDGALDVPEHDRRGCAQPHAVCRAHHLEPLLGIDLVGAEDGTHLVVENLGRRAGQAAEAGFLELQQVLLECPAHGGGALPNLEWREGVHVDLRLCGLDLAQAFEVPLACEARVDAALQADFGATATPRLDRATCDLALLEQVGRAAQVLGEATLREGAKAALEVADVRVVDVSTDDVGDVVADAFGAPSIREFDQEHNLRATCFEERLGVCDVEQLLGLGVRQRLSEGGGNTTGSRGWSIVPGERRCLGNAIRPAVVRSRAQLGIGEA